MTDPDNTATWDSIRVMLAPGDLLVGREGPALIVAGPRTPHQEATFDRLLDLCVRFSRHVTEATGAELVHALARVAAETPEADMPAFGVVTQGSSELLVTVAGDMQASMSALDGTVTVIDAKESLLPVNRILRGPLARLVVAPDPSAVTVDERSNLTAGVVRAGALVLAPGGLHAVDPQVDETVVDLSPVALASDPATREDAAPTRPDSASADSVTEDASARAGAGSASGFTVFSLTDTDADTEAEGHETPVEPPSAPTQKPLVRGIVCSRGHLNAPASRFCGHCGISMVHQTHNLVTGERPPLGVLVIDDGSTYPLVNDYVVGRDPESSDDVRAGKAAGLTLDDPGLALSRVHARIVLDGWEVRIEDAGSANGTFMASGQEDTWERLPAQTPTTISPGTRLRMGSRIVAFESHHGA